MYLIMRKKIDINRYKAIDINITGWGMSVIYIHVCGVNLKNC